MRGTFFFLEKNLFYIFKISVGRTLFQSHNHNHIWTKESLKTSNIRYVTVHKKWKFCRAVLLSPILALHGIYFFILHYNKYWTRESMQKGKFIFIYHVSSYEYCYIFAVNLLFLSFKKKKRKKEELGHSSLSSGILYILLLYNFYITPFFK